MLFFKNTTPDISPKKELDHNYAVLERVPKKDFERIFWNIASVHTHEYIDTLWAYFKKENGQIIKELLENLNINDEIINSYRILNSPLISPEEYEKWLDDIILDIILVHSKGYVKALQDYAEKNKNYLLVKKISEVQAEGERRKEEKIKSEIIKQYKKLADTLYWWSFQWSVYYCESDICMLLGKIIILFWEGDELATLCDNIMRDISKRWQDMLGEINSAIKYDKKWWYYENELLHINI